MTSGFTLYWSIASLKVFNILYARILGFEANLLRKAKDYAQFQDLRSYKICLENPNAGIIGKLHSGPQIKVCNRKLFFLFLNQSICRGYSKEPSR